MADFDPSSVEVAKVVDARGMSCPGPLLEAKKAIGTVSVGQILEIQSADASTKNDLPKWAKKMGHEFLGVTPADGYERMFIQRNK